MEDYNYNSHYVTQEKVTTSIESAFASLMKNVYTWMALGLAMTGITAHLVSTSNLVFTIASNSALMWGLIIAELALVIILSARIMKMSFLAAGLMFAGYAILNGVTMAFIFLVYTMESIAMTFFITAGTYAVMSLIGYFIKKDLSTMGRIFIMLLVGLIIATIVNFFVNSSGLMMVITYVGVIIFVGLTAYDTQKIKKMMLEYSEQGINDQTNKLALLGSLTLYLDFVNLFLYLLRIFGNRK